MDDFEWFKILIEEVTTFVVKITRKLKLEVEAEDMLELLLSHETLMDKEFFTDKERKCFLEMDALDQNSVKIFDCGASNPVPFKSHLYFTFKMASCPSVTRRFC